MAKPLLLLTLSLLLLLPTASAEEAASEPASPEAASASPGGGDGDGEHGKGDLLPVSAGGGTEGFYYVVHDQGNLGNYHGGEPQYITLSPCPPGCTLLG